MKINPRFFPFIFMALLCVMLALNLLQLSARALRVSHMIGKTPDAFTLPFLEKKQEVFTLDSLTGEVVVLHIFASWCPGCRIEHPRIMKLAASGKAKIIGIAWKDQPERTKLWLEKHGNPYQRVVNDEEGKSTLPLGLSGVPETFVLDKSGVVAYNLKTPMTEKELNKVLLPLIEELHARDR